MATASKFLGISLQNLLPISSHTDVVSFHFCLLQHLLVQHPYLLALDNSCLLQSGVKLFRRSHYVLFCASLPYVALYCPTKGECF